MLRGKPTRLSVMYRLHAALPVSQKIKCAYSITVRELPLVFRSQSKSKHIKGSKERDLSACERVLISSVLWNLLCV